MTLIMKTTHIAGSHSSRSFFNSIDISAKFIQTFLRRKSKNARHLELDINVMRIPKRVRLDINEPFQLASMVRVLCASRV